ncbi:hypothetical protein AYO20_09699 [Fonsecaea nubica]|uniref:MARVEL domain-containing protein n=1 Tax=Fonsecaea nubica TaxID=856822 RepID=A0A178CED2_9EURO|nr:hypothetical protein AYO20_09699 [Fonsecaea nubica]OAL27626.1 hypothetical protein AYO20_09699 [Fonsecaea nubica]
MKFRTRELDLSRALDETFLRIAEIGLRVLEGVWSIIIIGFMAAVMSGLADADADVPRKATATVVIACICTVYAGITILPMFFGGALFFSVSAVFDILFVAAWATLIGLWDGDATDSCRTFKTKYFDGRPPRSLFDTDCKLVKAMFAFMIVNLYLLLPPPHRARLPYPLESRFTPRKPHQARKTSTLCLLQAQREQPVTAPDLHSREYRANGVI